MLYFNMDSGELSDTDEAICNYVARKSEPESWNGDEESYWCLDRQPEIDYFGFGPRGLGIEEWRCPHPAMETDDGTAQKCIFHAEDLPDDVNWRQEIREEDGPGPNESVRGALTETAETVLGTCAEDGRRGRLSLRLGLVQWEFATAGKPPVLRKQSIPAVGAGTRP